MLLLFLISLVNYDLGVLIEVRIIAVADALLNFQLF